MAEATETLVLERDYASPPQHVFDAWTDVAVLKRWFGCAPDQLWTIHAWEPRPGGAIHVSLDFDGVPYVVRGEFAVVDPPHALTYRWQDDDVVTVRLEARGTGTHLRLEHTFVPRDEPAGIRAIGWTASLDSLATV